MPNQTINVRDAQESNQLEVRRMALYKQSQVIEATDDQEQVYYLIFYKQQYLNYLTPKKTPARSHVMDCFNKGITLNATHPLIDTIVSPYPLFKKQKFNDLFKKLQKQYTLQETALIARYFESFIKREKLADFIETLFYKERRDGRLLSCYRILQILKDFAPSHSLVTSFSGDMYFNKYEDLYRNGDEKILASDPIHVEKKLYSTKHNEQPFQKLLALYKEQNRWMDCIAIYISHTVHTQKQDDYQQLNRLIEERFDDQGKLVFLEDLYERGLHTDQLHKDLLNFYLEQQKLGDLIRLVNAHEMTLDSAQSQQMIEIVNQQGIIPDTIPPEGLQKLILALVESKSDQAGDVLHQTVASLLDNHSLSYVQGWAIPLRNHALTEPILEKIDEMKRIFDDPNQQQRLGELYHEFKQPKLAIDCMSWDMELRENDPKPVQWLAKLYHELGMDEEHKAYQQLYVDMVKRL